MSDLLRAIRCLLRGHEWDEYGWREVVQIDTTSNLRPTTMLTSNARREARLCRFAHVEFR